ncbi:EKC/KEOPS complex subunit [Lachnellula hyalina]|uniref:EKC/KEOPS complex subunit CGI121 n=1 Tax=Lachnellula hyalina TaxID=1316788 RepID=A0A8H8R4S4_9HELO|nr:EKC/KEOPS complex subunit [Lachnellula hyalina]TVY28343.1 EKC/KEOPS complex subunit [Lachnellula hyalina]
MALLETIHLEHLPTTPIHISLYRNVKNAPFLQQQLLAGNTDFEYAFIDASVIVSRIHVLSAAYRAINALHSHRLRSRNVHSEIVFSLSPNNNIAESFRRFGITATTENLLVVKVGGGREEVKRHLEGAVEGEAVGGMLDVGKVRKVYKLNSGGGGGKKGLGNGVVNEEEERRELEVFVLGAMALRGASN